MNVEPVVIQGVVRADGTLELEGKVPLPAGKVSVTVRPASADERVAGFEDFMCRIRAIRERDGVKPDAEAAQAALRKLRDDVAEEVAEIGRLQDDCRRQRLEAEAAGKVGG